MFCREFGSKTAFSQAKCQAAPDVLPGIWAKNSLFPGGMPGDAVGFAGSLGQKQPFSRRNARRRRVFCREFTPAEEATPHTQTKRPDLTSKPGRGNQFSLINQLT